MVQFASHLIGFANRRSRSRAIRNSKVVKVVPSYSSVKPSAGNSVFFAAVADIIVAQAMIAWATRKGFDAGSTKDAFGVD